MQATERPHTFTAGHLQVLKGLERRCISSKGDPQGSTAGQEFESRSSGSYMKPLTIFSVLVKKRAQRMAALLLPTCTCLRETVRSHGGKMPLIEEVLVVRNGPNRFLTEVKWIYKSISALEHPSSQMEHKPLQIFTSSVANCPTTTTIKGIWHARSLVLVWNVDSLP